MSVSQAAQRRSSLPNIGRCRKFGSVSHTERTAQRNDFERILTVKLETRHPVEESFESEYTEYILF